MGFLVVPRHRSSERGRRWCFLPLALLLTCAACDGSFRPASHTVPGPGDAIAAVPLSGSRIAILAGTPNAKGVFVINERDGTVAQSFGVTKEATGISAVSSEGPLLLSVGIQDGARSVGAVEQWTLAGEKQRVIPLPLAALGITRVAAGEAFALGGNARGVRAAFPLDVPSLRIGKPVPLRARAAGLEQCLSRNARFLLYADDAHGRLTLHDLATGADAPGPLSVLGATCHQQGDVAYVIDDRGPFGRSVTVLNVPNLSRVSSYPVSRDAIALYETDDHHLVALNSAGRTGTIETFKEQSSDIRTAEADVVAPDLNANQ